MLGVVYKTPRGVRTLTSHLGQTEPSSLATGMEELVSIPDASEATRPSTGVGRARRRQMLPRNRPPRGPAVISATGQGPP